MQDLPPQGNSWSIKNNNDVKIKQKDTLFQKLLINPVSIIRGKWQRETTEACGYTEGYLRFLWMATWGRKQKGLANFFPKNKGNADEPEKNWSEIENRGKYLMHRCSREKQRWTVFITVNDEQYLFFPFATSISEFYIVII